MQRGDWSDEEMSDDEGSEIKREPAKHPKFDESSNYYELLGVSNDAPRHVINTAARNKMRELHETRHPELKIIESDSEAEKVRKAKELDALKEKYTKVREAHLVLWDPESRKAYDEFSKKFLAKLDEYETSEKKSTDSTKLPPSRSSSVDQPKKAVNQRGLSFDDSLGDPFGALSSDPFGTPLNAPVVLIDPSKLAVESLVSHNSQYDSAVARDLAVIRKAAEAKQLNELNQYDSCLLEEMIQKAVDISPRWIRAVEFCLKLKADPNIKLTNPSGRYHTTLLHKLANGEFDGEQGDQVKYDILNLLLKHKADPAVKDGRGNSPLHFAFLYANFQVIKRLLSYLTRPGFELVNQKGETPLHIAPKGVISELLFSAKTGLPTEYHSELKELLISHQFDLEARDWVRGNTPLLTAAQYGNWDLESFFESCGANPHATNMKMKGKWNYVVNRGDSERMAHALKHSQELRLSENILRLLGGAVQAAIERGERQLLTYLMTPEEEKSAAKIAYQKLPLYDWPLEFKVQDKGKRLVLDFSVINIPEDFSNKELLIELLSQANVLIDSKEFNAVLELERNVLKTCPTLKAALTPQQKTSRYICCLVEAAVDEARGREATEKLRDGILSQPYLSGYLECNEIIVTNPANREYVSDWEIFTKLKVAIRDLQFGSTLLAIDSLVTFLKVLPPFHPNFSLFLNHYKHNLTQFTSTYLEKIIDGWLNPHFKDSRGSTSHILRRQFGGEIPLLMAPVVEPSEVIATEQEVVTTSTPVVLSTATEVKSMDQQLPSYNHAL